MDICRPRRVCHPIPVRRLDGHRAVALIPALAALCEILNLGVTSKPILRAKEGTSL